MYFIPINSISNPLKLNLLFQYLNIVPCFNQHHSTTFHIPIVIVTTQQPALCPASHFLSLYTNTIHFRYIWPCLYTHLMNSPRAPLSSHFAGRIIRIFVTMRRYKWNRSCLSLTDSSSSIWAYADTHIFTRSILLSIKIFIFHHFS